MFFGGSNGFNAFYPAQIEDNPHLPPVLITDFQLANKPVPIGAGSVLQKSILETDKLVLSYRDRVFSFEFAALNYRGPEQTRYKYRMEGFEKAWNEVDRTRRFATYTNLDPGDYVFRAIGSNNDGVWNEEGASIHITVTPPWWETMWSRISMVLVAIALLAGGFRWRVSAIEARSRKFEIQVIDRTKELQKAKEEAENANRAKSTFLTNMSHELRTPLHAILGFSRLLTRDSGINEEQQERLDIINRSGEHLLGMVDDILSLSRIEAGRIELKLETFDITQMLQDVGQMMKSRAEGKGLRFTLELDPALPPFVQGDVGKLRQVLINLLGNAVKFTETGEVWLRVRSQPVADDSDMIMLQLEVQDSGPGIPQDKLDKVFETFVRLDHAQNTESGTGLGLAISKSLLDMMDGEILVESEPGQGTRLKVTIPFKLAEAGTAAPSEEPVAKVIGLQADQPEWRILVVDDNFDNRVLLSTMLSQIGCIVREAQNGEEAVSIFQEWQPHFIWMDMRMPVLDGYAATRKIRTLPGGEAVKIVAVTASVLAEQQEEILASGCDELVRKPFRDHEIFESMARQLGIKYLYKDRGAETAQGINLTAEMLAGLPPDLLQELRETTLELNQEAILEVIDRIEEHAPDTAGHLRTLVQNFEMDRIRELLGEVKGEKME
jgi:signal transduction histidine kinase/DNA-binding NarL/FixJ family response regulator